MGTTSLSSLDGKILGEEVNCQGLTVASGHSPQGAKSFDVVSHDPTLGRTAKGHGKFALAEYIPNREKR